MTFVCIKMIFIEEKNVYNIYNIINVIFFISLYIYINQELYVCMKIHKDFNIKRKKVMEIKEKKVNLINQLPEVVQGKRFRFTFDKSKVITRIT